MSPCTESRVDARRAHGIIITSSWRQNDVETSFWRHNDVIIASCTPLGVNYERFASCVGLRFPIHEYIVMLCFMLVGTTLTQQSPIIVMVWVWFWETEKQKKKHFAWDLLRMRDLEWSTGMKPSAEFIQHSPRLSAVPCIGEVESTGFS